MNKQPLTTNTEPVVTVATISSLVAAAIALGVSFGLPLTDEQQKAILAFVAVVAPLVTIYARQYVVPVQKLDANGDLKAQYRQDLG